MQCVKKCPHRGATWMTLTQSCYTLSDMYIDISCQ